MAEWWVDPDNGSETNAGTSASVPWKLIPGQTGATAQTGYAVTAGDTINVKNGSRSTLRVVVPADNLTYRGYGLGGNMLWLVLPAGVSKVLVPVYRQRGAHEGMWILDDGQAGTYGMFTTNTRSGTVVEDMHLIAPTSTTPLSFGTSGSTAIGATARRCWIQGSAATGIDAYTRQITIEDTRVENCQDDGITLGASVANGYRAGYTDRIERASIINVGLNETTALGDLIQTFAASNRFESPLIIRDLYGYKPNTVKQGVVVTDMLGGFTLERFYFEGPTDSHCQVLLNGLRGRALIRQGVFKGGCVNNPAIRFAQDNGVGMATGSTLTVESVILDAERHAGLFNFASGVSAVSIDGKVRIYNSYVTGQVTIGLSFSAAISCHPSSVVTYGANAELLVANCIVGVSAGSASPAIRLPSGGENDARWKFQNNLFVASSTFVAGANTYSTLAAFEAAHNQATNNVAADDPLLDSSYRPTVNSPCVGAGIYIPGAKHFGGKAMDGGSPDIGAFRSNFSNPVI